MSILFAQDILFEYDPLTDYDQFALLNTLYRELKKTK